MKTMRILLVMALAAVTGTVQATLYSINDIKSGSGGFGASLFHDASGSNYMSGATIGDIVEGAGIFGTYDDVTGALNATGMGLAAGGTFSLTGTLLFDGSGLLSADSVVFVDFDATAEANHASLNDTIIGFKPGYVCCGNNGYDPNSFLANNSDMWMTLWGADFGIGGIDPNGGWNGTYDGAKIGMDIRLSMTEISVPEPSILALLGLGLVAVGFTRRNS